MDAAQPGVQIEGEVIEATDSELLAFRAWQALHNGMGGIDWAGWDRVMAWLGVQDEQRLLDQLLVIKAYRPDETDLQDDETTKDDA